MSFKTYGLNNKVEYYIDMIIGVKYDRKIQKEKSWDM